MIKKQMHTNSNRAALAFTAAVTLFMLTFQTAWAIWPFDKEDSNQSSQTEMAQTEMPKAEQKEESLKIDAILTTLNESLEENKKLRIDAESAQDEYNKASIENNVLRSQLRSLQAEFDASKSQTTAKEVQMQKEMEKLKDQIRNLKSESEKSEEFKKFAEQTLIHTEAENAKVKNILKSSILESERDAYVKVLGESQKKANEAAEQMMLAKRQNERMRSELASAYYNLGNMLANSGQYRSALTEYKKSLKLNPNDAWAHYNSAIIYDYYLNKHEKALLHYKKYLNLEPAEKELNKVRERVLEMELVKPVTPGQPLRPDFNDYQDQLNKSYTINAKSG